MLNSNNFIKRSILKSLFASTVMLCSLNVFAVSDMGTSKLEGHVRGWLNVEANDHMFEINAPVGVALAMRESVPSAVTVKGNVGYTLYARVLAADNISPANKLKLTSPRYRAMSLEGDVEISREAGNAVAAGSGPVMITGRGALGGAGVAIDNVAIGGFVAVAPGAAGTDRVNMVGINIPMNPANLQAFANQGVTYNLDFIYGPTVLPAGVYTARVTFIAESHY